MAKKKEVEETVESVLSKINETKSLKAKIISELKTNIPITDNPEDIHCFEYALPEYSTRHYINLHVKCLETGKEKIGQDYILNHVDTIRKDDKGRSGTICKECGERLNSSLYKQKQKESRERIESQKKAHADFKARKLEEEKEKVLLGLV